MTSVTPIAFVSSTALLLRVGKTVVVTFAPFGFFVVSYGAAFLIAPATSAPFQAEYQAFFGGAAVVLATVLVTLVVQAGLFKSRPIRTAVRFGVCYIVLGELAAMVSLSPVLDPTVARHAFALTVSAGLASLAAVLLIAFRSLPPEEFRLNPLAEGNSLLEQVPDQPSPITAVTTEAPLPVTGRGASVPPEVELTPAAVKDLHNLGSRTGANVSGLLQRFLSDPSAAWGASRISGTQWSALPLGTVHALYRPLTPDDGGGQGVVVARIIPRREIATVAKELS